MADVIKLKSRVSKGIQQVIDEQCDGNVTRFAAVTGQSRISVHEWTRGSKLPSLLSLVTICEKFKVPAEKLIGV